MPFICMIRHQKFVWQEDRAFSHGCIRVSQRTCCHDYENDGILKIETAMNSGENIGTRSKTKFQYTLVISPAWVDADGVVHFYEDV
jgi:murein L,D-transpeptidase YcbB/YkuD